VGRKEATTGPAIDTECDDIDANPVSNSERGCL